MQAEKGLSIKVPTIRKKKVIHRCLAAWRLKGTNPHGLVPLRSFYWLFIIFLFFVSVSVVGQDTTTGSPFSHQSWKELTEPLDYGQTQKRESAGKEIKPRKNGPVISGDASAVFRAILFVFGGLVIAIVIAMLLGWGKVKNKKIDPIGIRISELEDNLPESDIDPFLAKALTDKDFRLAIRLHYLRCLQKLARENLIQWQKEKTNKHYLIETARHLWHTEWENLTRQYEHIYYGGRDIDQAIYEDLAPQFHTFQQIISSPEKITS